MRDKTIVKNPVVIVDDEFGDLLDKYNWFIDAGGYVTAVINGKYRKLHRIVMGDPPGVIDHINHNKSDNRKDNLRVVTQRQNCQNKKSHGMWPVGLYWDKHSNKFKGQILINKRVKSLGRFIDPITPKILYDMVVDELEQKYNNI